MYLPDHIVFVGYQAYGTLGRRIVDGETELRIAGEDVIVKARVHTIGGFSAHGDRDDVEILSPACEIIMNSPLVYTLLYYLKFPINIFTDFQIHRKSLESVPNHLEQMIERQVMLLVHHA